MGTVSAQTPKENKKLKVEIAKGKLLVNGKELAVPGDLSAFQKAFGKPSGVAQDPVIADNKYIFWNSLGFAASQSQKGKKPVEENLFSFGPMSDLAAKAQSKPFTGALIVEGEVLTKNTSKDDVKKKIKKGRDVFGGWRVEFEGGPFYVDINPTEKGTESVNVVQPLVNR